MESLRVQSQMSPIIWLLTLLGLARPSPSAGEFNLQGLNTSEVARSVGFVAQDHFVTTRDGYKLNLVRLLNPLINGGQRGNLNRIAVMFIHGEFASAGVFISNIRGAEPRDFSEVDTSKWTTEELVEALKDEPVAKSLALLLSCFGHEVWLLNRRGTNASLDHVEYEAYGPDATKSIGSTSSGEDDQCDQSEQNSSDKLAKILKEYELESVGSRYWNFSQDQQTFYDLPESIRYILNVTEGSKISLVGHSSGSAQIMTFLSSFSEANNFVANSIHLSPSIYQSHSMSAPKLKVNAIDAILSNYSGPFSFPALTKQVDCLVTDVCTESYNRSACTSSETEPDDVVGNDPEADEAFVNQAGQPVSSFQTVHQAQARKKCRMYRYDFGSADGNLAAYGSEEPPVYDLAKINSTLSLYHGLHDTTATPKDVARLIEDLKGEVLEHFIGNSSIHFSHNSPLIHKQVARLVNVPALKEIQSL